MQSVQDVLRDLGLSEKEITIYLMLLQVGTSPASTLAQRTGFVRSTVQYTCQQLVGKGIVSMTLKNNVYLFTADPPEKLLKLLEREQQAIQDKGENVQKILGSLKEMMNPTIPIPKVRFYEGRAGMIELYDNILELRSPIDSFEDKGEMMQFIPDYALAFIKRRVSMGIFNRVICASDNQINPSTPKELRETRTLKTEEFPFTCDIKICADQVSMFSFSHHTAVGIAIIHPEIANNYRILFEAFWKRLGSSGKA